MRLITIQCSNCGKKARFPYSTVNVMDYICSGWESYGNALYCPECSELWKKRNPDKDLANARNTMYIIDKIANN